ncbi:cytochrome P450 78A3-like [Solanum pennellii]|uniref:Cytochrome P450 78A3-like n=1 Tax=Solanum pennellii TaxID=28526 RepID=A0ABM1GF06_SOLPN|nr:cytochrome P450 78A3-like [Solanum pennellii]XP_015070207.1 cytochrome P450 78A3-like [Solanum pennellii]
MRTDIESLWIFALASKCKSFTSIYFILFIVLFWLLMNIIYWSHPGGPAWGKYNWSKKIRSASFNNNNNNNDNNNISGPRGFPIIGSMNLMSGLAHRKIAEMAQSCVAKRLMSFSLGETRVIITCNPDVAKEILNSSVFADRPVKESAYSLMFNRAIGFAPYGVYWRTLRKIAATHLFCPKQIKASEAQRFQIARQMVTMFQLGGQDVVRVKDALKLASLNNMMCSVFGRKYSLDCCNEETEELGKLVEEGYELLGMLNWSDHLPWLAEFDPQKIRLRCSRLVPKVNKFVSRIINEHKAQSGDVHHDFVHVLLSLQGSERLSDSDMIAVLWEMIFRGTDTVAVLIEWILARMVIHPQVQSKVQTELDCVVEKSRALMESDVSEMTYLPAVIKEVLRLHPPGPLLSWARLAITDTTVDGYHVPAGTTAMVNMWAITRDPDVWADPLEFKPERFLNGPDFSVLGSDLRLAPFGSGRRTCPGKTLGLTTVTFWVATLLHEFRFGPIENNGPVDLSEVLRLSCEMVNPLTVRVRPRHAIHQTQ